MNSKKDQREIYGIVRQCQALKIREGIHFRGSILFPLLQKNTLGCATMTLVKWERRWELAMICGLLLNASSQAEDWHQFRGPKHDGISAESDWRKDWDVRPPILQWQAEVGIGFSAISVSKGKVLTTGHINGQDIIWCLDALNGNPIWSYRYESRLGAKFYIGGPGSTPSIDVSQNHVFALGKWGEVFCLDFTNGSVIWKRNLAKEENFEMPTWGFNGSILIVDSKLILNLGQSGIALDKKTGKTLWRSEGDACGYSTPLPFDQGQISCVALSSEEAYSGVTLSSGKRIWSIPWTTRHGVNAADPIFWNGQVFLSSGYGKGSALFSLDNAKPKEIWRQRRFRAQQNAPVRLGKFLYGFDGNSTSRTKLKCIAWENGEILWEEDRFKYGALMAADGYLIVIASDGRLAIAKANATNFEPIITRSFLPPDCWTVPVLANGRLFCRNSKGRLVSLDVSQK